ncbi:MAG: hypothetical protein ABJB09_00720 [Verrucomicrobiota bacterium]
MLPFRSGRTRFSGASWVFILFALVSFSALAADKKGKDRADPKSKPKELPKAKEGLTSIPIPIGHGAKGLVFPDFDLNGHMRGRLEAGTTKRLDEEHLEFQGVKFTTFATNEQPDLEVTVNTSTFNLQTQVLTSSERATVKRSDFEVSGDTMKFEMSSRQGTLTGNVKMVVHGKARNSGADAQ